MITVNITYYAVLREHRGQSAETCATPAATAAELYEELAARHGITLPQTALKVAVNDTFAPWSTPLRDGDRVAFIPPVAGG